MFNAEVQAHQEVRRLTQERGTLLRAMGQGDLPSHELRQRLAQVERAIRESRRDAGRRWS